MHSPARKPNCESETLNPFLAPCADIAPSQPLSRSTPVTRIRLTQIAYALRVLNLLVVGLVALILVTWVIGLLEVRDTTFTLDTLLIGGTGLSVVLIVCLMIPMLFFVFPVAVSVFAIASLIVPGSWFITFPVTLFAINARGRQILNDHGMAVGVLGDSMHVAQSVDGPSIELNPYGKIVDRGLTYVTFAALIGYLVLYYRI